MQNCSPLDFSKIKSTIQKCYCKKDAGGRFEVCAAMMSRIQVFCTAMLSSRVMDFWLFKRRYCLHLQGSRSQSIFEQSLTLVHARDILSTRTICDSFKECTTFTSRIDKPATQHKNPEDMNPQYTGDCMHILLDSFDLKNESSAPRFSWESK
jgi:hypothetical protein